MGRRGPKKADEEDAPTAVRDFRAQAAVKVAEVEAALEPVLEERRRQFQLLLAAIPDHILNMPFLQFIENPPAEAEEPVTPKADDVYTFQEPTPEAPGNTTAALEETFALPTVPAAKRAKATRPPLTNQPMRLNALKTPATAAAFNASCLGNLTTPGTELRAPRVGEMMLSTRGSPLMAGPDGIDMDTGVATVLRTKGGQGLVVTGSPFDPSRPAPDIDMDTSDAAGLRNLRDKINVLLRGKEGK